MSRKAHASRTTPPLPLNRRFSYRLNMIGRALGQEMLLHVGREFGLNLAEYRILSVLADGKPPSIRDIAAHTQLDKAHVTRVLADLIRRGFVTQIVDKRDRRLRVVELTQAGRATIAATLPHSIERQRRLEQRLTESELRILWSALSVLSEEAEQMLAEEAQKGARRGRDVGLSEPASIPGRRKSTR